MRTNQTATKQQISFHCALPKNELVARQGSSKIKEYQQKQEGKPFNVYLRSNIDNSETFFTCHQNRPHGFRRDQASKMKRQGPSGLNLQ